MAVSPLFLRLAAVLITLTVVEVGYRARVVSSFIPERSLRAAVDAGDGCVATFGDSRMVAGVVSGVLTAELTQAGSTMCHAGLAIGGGNVVAHLFALRRYLEAGRKPKLIVLGTTLESTLERETPPESLIGNQAVVLGWSRPGDVSLLYPGFPRDHFDHGFRFLVGRSLSTLAFGSLAWARVQALQDRVVGKAETPGNRFGLVDDMQALARALTRDVEERIQAFPRHLSLHPALLALLDLAARHGVPVLLVELPMPARYRAALARADRAPSLRAALADRVTMQRGSTVDLGRPSWLDEQHFEDGLHLGADGAALFSRDLAQACRRALDPI